MSTAGLERDEPDRPITPPGARLRLQAVANTFGNLAFFAVIFLLTPLAIRELGSEGWGIWQLVNGATAYGILLAMGLGAAIHYQVPYNLARGDVDRLASAFTNARLYLGVAALVLLGLLFSGGRPLMESLVEADRVELAWMALLATVVPTALTFPLRIYPSAIGGLQRLDLMGLVQTVSALLLFGGIWLGFRAGMELRGFALLMTFGALLPILPAWILAHRMLPAGSLRFTAIDVPLLREILTYSVNSLIYAIGTAVLYQMMKFLAAWRCGGATAAGEIGLAISIVQTLGVVFVPLFTTLLARFGQLHGSERSEEMRHLIRRALVAGGLLVVPSGIFLMTAADSIFAAWVGGELDAGAVARIVTATRWMLIGQVVYVLALPFYFALLGIGEHRSFGLGMLVAALANAMLGWWAAGRTQEIESLAIAFSASLFGLIVFVTAPAALRRFGLSDWSRTFASAVLAPLAASLPGAAFVAWRPRIGTPVVDLLIDAAGFTLLTAPGLEIARRRVL